MTPTFALMAILHADWRDGRSVAEIARRINRTLGLVLTVPDVLILAREQGWRRPPRVTTPAQTGGTL